MHASMSSRSQFYLSKATAPPLLTMYASVFADLKVSVIFMILKSAMKGNAVVHLKHDSIFVT